MSTSILYPPERTQAHALLSLDIQNDYIDHIATRMVIPLRRDTRTLRTAGQRPCIRNAETSGADGLVLDTAAHGCGSSLAELLTSRVARLHRPAARTHPGSDGHPLRILLT